MIKWLFSSLIYTTWLALHLCALGGFFQNVLTMAFFGAIYLKSFWNKNRLLILSIPKSCSLILLYLCKKILLLAWERFEPRSIDSNACMLPLCHRRSVVYRPINLVSILSQKQWAGFWDTKIVNKLRVINSYFKKILEGIIVL